MPKVMLFSTSTCSWWSSGEAVFQGAPRAVQGGQQTFPITTRRFRVVLPGGRLELAEAYRQAAAGYQVC